MTFGLPPVSSTPIEAPPPSLGSAKAKTQALVAPDVPRHGGLPHQGQRTATLLTATTAAVLAATALLGLPGAALGQTQSDASSQVEAEVQLRDGMVYLSPIHGRTFDIAGKTYELLQLAPEGSPILGDLQPWHPGTFDLSNAYVVEQPENRGTLHLVCAEKFSELATTTPTSPSLSAPSDAALAASPIAPVQLGVEAPAGAIDGRLVKTSSGVFALVPIGNASSFEHLNNEHLFFGLEGSQWQSGLQDQALVSLDLADSAATISDDGTMLWSQQPWSERITEGLPRTVHGVVVQGKLPGAHEDSPADHLMLMLNDTGVGSEVYLDGRLESEIVHLGPATAEALKAFPPGNEIIVEGRVASVELKDGPSARLVSTLTMQSRPQVGDVQTPTLINDFACIGDRQLTQFLVGFADNQQTVRESLAFDYEQGLAFRVHTAQGDNSLKVLQQYELFELSGTTMPYELFMGGDAERRNFEIEGTTSFVSPHSSEHWQVVKDTDSGELYRVHFDGEGQAEVVARMRPITD